MPRLRARLRQLVSGEHVEGPQTINSAAGPSASVPPASKPIFDNPPWLGFGHQRSHGVYSKEFALYLPVHEVYHIVELTSSTEDTSEYKISMKSVPLEARIGDLKHIQAWFTFGLLESALDWFVRDEWLINTNENGQKILCLDHVPQLLDKWSISLQSMGDRARDSLQVFRKNIHVCMELLPRLKGMLSPNEEDTLTWKATFFTIICLGEYMHTFFVFLTRAHHVESLWPNENPHEWAQQLFDYTNIFEAEYARQGLCLSMIDYIRNSANATLLKVYFHGNIKDRRDHRSCTRRAPCQAANIDERTYKTLHICSQGNCAILTPCYGDVVACIEAGVVPQVCLDAKNVGREIVVRSHSQQSHPTSYVAFSHVWADGLGSCTEKGLPRCQLERLQLLAERTIEGGFFWIDSLCIPKEKSYRAKAISMMRNVYQDAKAVVVLDGSFLEQSIPSDDIAKIFESMFAMQWMRRMWTLEEAILARRKAFAFKDAIIPLTSLQVTFQQRLSSLEMNALMFPIQAILYPKPLEDYNFASITAMLSTRATSNPADEPLVIASLLGLDAGQLVSLDDPEMSMKQLLLNVRYIPKSIVLLQTRVGRLHIPGFTWAPKSFLGMSTQMSHATDAECTPDGLVAQYYVLAVTSRIKATGHDWWLIDQDQKELFEVMHPLDSDISIPFDLILLLDRTPKTSSRVVNAISVRSQSAWHSDGTKKVEEEILMCTFSSTVGLHCLARGADIQESMTTMCQDDDNFCFVQQQGWRKLRIA